jgi:hypothetical protein
MSPRRGALRTRHRRLTCPRRATHAPSLPDVASSRHTRAVIARAVFAD